MGRILISAMNSGSGKTLVTMAVLEVLRRRGEVCISMKCGPDYIDPMFHSRLLGVPCRNLDLHLMGEAQVLREAAAAGSAGQVVMEGAMGFYDGIGGTDEASAYRVARLTETPVILVVTPKGESLSLAAKLRGMQDFREGAGIAGVILNRCSRRLHDHLKPIIERENEIPVLGFLPDMPEAAIGSRHLGLITAGEIEDLEGRIRVVADAAEDGIDFDQLLEIAARAPRVETGGGKAAREERLAPGCGCGEEAARAGRLAPEGAGAKGEPCAEHSDSEGGREGASPVAVAPRCRIAVARDEAFSFYYESGFEALRRAGAELAFFSPLRDAGLPPETDALYLGGGYPELYARELSENEAMRADILRSLKAGLPVLAECGGFLYLGQSIEPDEGEKQALRGNDGRAAAGDENRPTPDSGLTAGQGSQSMPGSLGAAGGDTELENGGKVFASEARSVDMVGFLPGRAHREKHLVRFGYAFLTSATDSMLVRRGERVPCHEFHYYESSDKGAGLISEKPDGTRAVACGFVNDHMYAAFPHLSLAGQLPLAERFADAAAEYRKSREKKA